MYFVSNQKIQDMFHVWDLFPTELNEVKAMDIVIRQ